MALSTTFTQCTRKLPNSVKITQNKAISPFKVIQCHRYWYQSKAHTRFLYASYIKTIARQVLRIKSWIYESAKNLYRRRRAVPLQTFPTRHSDRKLSIALSITFTQYAMCLNRFIYLNRKNDKILTFLADVNSRSRSRLAIAIPSVVCLSVRRLSVTLVHPTQAVELFGNFFHHTIAHGLYFSGAKNRWWGTPLSPWNFRLKWPTPFQIAKFRPISAHSASTVIASEKKFSFHL